MTHFWNCINYYHAVNKTLFSSQAVLVKMVMVGVMRMTVILGMSLGVCVNDHYILASGQEAHAGPVAFP